MRIEEGKYYRTRDGRKVGPLSRRDSVTRPFEATVGFEDPDRVTVAIWGENGCNLEYRRLDLVAEWTDEGPVRTVERKEIVPGVYGRIEVMKPLNDKAVIGIVNLTHGVADFGVDLTADELDNAAAVFTALAGALRANG